MESSIVRPVCAGRGRGASTPAAPAKDFEHNDRPELFIRWVLFVSGEEQASRQLLFRLSRDHSTSAVKPHPGESRPILGPHMNEECRQRVPVKIPKTLQFTGSFGFAVDRCVNRAATESEHTGHEVR